MTRNRHKFAPLREVHVIQYLTRYGPTTYDELMRACPGNIGGRADRVARRLINEGRLDPKFIKDDQG